MIVRLMNEELINRILKMAMLSSKEVKVINIYDNPPKSYI